MDVVILVVLGLLVVTLPLSLRVRGRRVREVEDKVETFASAFETLVARIESVLEERKIASRNPPSKETPAVSASTEELGSTKVELANTLLSKRDLFLTPTEFKLLYHLALARSRTTTFEALKLMWEYDERHTDILRRHIQRLRKELPDFGMPDDLDAVSIRGIGSRPRWFEQARRADRPSKAIRRRARVLYEPLDALEWTPTGVGV